MDYFVFISKYENEKAYLRRTADLVYEKFESIPDEKKFQMKEINKLFFDGNRETMSKSVFYGKKSVISDLYKQYQDEIGIETSVVDEINALKLDDVISDRCIDSYYFESLDSVLDLITHIGAQNDLGSNTDLLYYKTSVILAWNGFDKDEIVNAKKTDLDFKSQSIRRGDGTAIGLGKNFKTVASFCDIDVHKGFPSGKIQRYVESGYLFRSQVSPQISVNNLSCALRAFNETFESWTGKKLNIPALNKNGLFERVFNAQSADGKRTSISLIKEMEGCDKAMAFGYSRIYEKWVNFYK